MDKSYKVGLSFGLTSGVITTIGLIVGLYTGTYSELAVLGGVLTIAIADAFSDALGIHVSEEAQRKKTKEIWGATLSTFISKFAVAMTFVVPILLLKFSTAVIVSVAWGLLLLGMFSFKIAQEQNTNPVNVVTEHITIAICVIFVTYYLGGWIRMIFV